MFTIFKIGFYGSWLLLPLAIFLLWLIIEKRKYIFIVLLIITITLIWMRFGEIRLLRVKEYDINKNSSENIKVAVISDLHFTDLTSDKFITKLIAKTNALNPDIILFPGDFTFIEDPTILANKFSQLKNLHAPKIAVLGNHDHHPNNSEYTEQIIQLLKAQDITVLLNQNQSLELRGQQVRIAGLDDPWTGYPDYPKFQKGTEDILIGLIHNPDAYYESKYQPEIMITGHTHGGQIRIPWLYQMIIPTNYHFDKGLYSFPTTNLLVSPGIGNVLVPFRFLNIPEISVLNIPVKP